MFYIWILQVYVLSLQCNQNKGGNKMDALRKIFENELMKKPIEDKAEKQKVFYQKSKDKGEEIIKKLAFLQDYGFTFNLFTSVNSDYGETEGYDTYKIRMMFKGTIFAILNPIWESTKYDLSSYHIDFGTRRFYNYRDFLIALSDRVKIN